MYEPNPVVQIRAEHEISIGLDEVAARLDRALPTEAVIAIECYPTITEERIDMLMKQLNPSLVIDAKQLFQDAKTASIPPQSCCIGSSGKGLPVAFSTTFR